MDYSIEAINDYMRRITVKIPKDELEKSYRDKLEEYRQEVAIPGFRKGKVPYKLFEAKFGEDVRSEVTESILEETTRDIYEKEELRIIGQAKLTDTQEEKDETIWTLEVEVIPKVELKRYTGFNLKRVVSSVSNEEIETAIRSLQEQQAEFIPKEIVEEGDYLLIDYIAEGEKKPTEYNLVMRGKLLDTFGGLLGAHPGETRKLKVHLPEDLQGEKRGKTEYAEITVKEIKKKVLPEVNDEFAATIGNYKSIKELKEKIRESIQKRKEESSIRRLRDDAVAALIEANPFELPPSLIEAEAEKRAETMVKSGYIREEQKELFRKQSKEKIIFRLKREILLTRIAEKENIEPPEETVEERVNQMARSYNVDPNKLFAELSKTGELEQIEEEVKLEEALNFVIENSNVDEITEENPKEEK